MKIYNNAPVSLTLFYEAYSQRVQYKSQKKNDVNVKCDIVENMIYYICMFWDISSNYMSGIYKRRHAYTN